MRAENRFEESQWEIAKHEVKTVLAERARSRRTISYSELCAEVGSLELEPRSWALTRLLNEVCSEEDASRGTMLASLVTHKGGDGLPGRGYFAHAERLGRDIPDPRAFWEVEVERVFSAWADPKGPVT